jgi:hypothetical protein
MLLLAAGMLPLFAGFRSADVQQTTTLNGVIETVEPMK